MSEHERSGRVAIITGGTGALGRVVQRAFLARGDRVVLPWIVKTERDAIAAEQGDEIASGRLTLVECDASEADAARELVRSAGEVDVLVNGVGGFAGGTPLHETDLDVWDRMYRINVRSVAAMSAAVLPGMLTRGRGAIVNVSSQAAQDCPATLAAYSASKAAVTVLTRTLQNEVAAAGLRVNAVVPATIDTPANREAMPEADFSAWTAPERIAQVIIWLASDAASAVRGGLIPV